MTPLTTLRVRSGLSSNVHRQHQCSARAGHNTQEDMRQMEHVDDSETSFYLRP